MADWVVVDGVPPWDGRYELFVGDGLTTREWGWIKRLAGYLPLQVDLEAFGDPEFVCVLVAIALRRAGKIDAADVPRVFDALVDAPPEAAFQIEVDNQVDQEDDAGPPDGNSILNGDVSGDDSSTRSEKSAPTPLATGTLALDSSESDQATSGN